MTNLSLFHKNKKSEHYSYLQNRRRFENFRSAPLFVINSHNRQNNPHYDVKWSTCGARCSALPPSNFHAVYLLPMANFRYISEDQKKLVIIMSVRGNVYCSDIVEVFRRRDQRTESGGTWSNEDNQLANEVAVWSDEYNNQPTRWRRGARRATVASLFGPDLAGSNYIRLFITNKGAHLGNFKTSTVLQIAVNCQRTYTRIQKLQILTNIE